MDYTPHTHEVKLKFRQTSPFPRFASQTEIQYGDTYVRIAATRRTNRWSAEKLARRVHRAALKAIAKHDRGSLKLAKPEAAKVAAGQTVQALNRKVLDMKQPYYDRARRAWGSELLREEVKNDV